MNDGEHIPRLKGIEGGGVGDWCIAPLHVILPGMNGPMTLTRDELSSELRSESEVVRYGDGRST
jgi:hypothetical protein